MTPTHHSLCNTILKRPPGTTEEECRDLHIQRTQDTAGHPVVCSFWRPEPEELAALNEGGTVRFSCWGHTHPPMHLAVTEDSVEAIVSRYETDHAIVARLCNFHFYEIGISDERPDLEALAGYSLTRLLEACHRVDLENKQPDPENPDGTRKIQVIPDDRLVAAIYAFIHFQLRDEDPGQETLMHDRRQALVITKVRTD